MRQSSVVTSERSWFGDLDRMSRTLRVTPHPSEGVVTLSLWDGSRCTGTHRMPLHEVPVFIGALADGLAFAVPAPPRAVPPAAPATGLRSRWTRWVVGRRWGRRPSSSSSPARPALRRVK